MAKFVPYVGNKTTREFHRVKSIQPQCNFASIKPKNRVEFQRGRDAINAKFDPCHFCNKYFRSLENE